MDIINFSFALASIVLGCFGWLAPKYTMDQLNLAGHTDTMGMSEVRASAGCLFVGMGLGAFILGSPAGYIMLGASWLGASVGRLTSCMRDGGTRKKWIYFGVEVSVGLLAILLNV